MNFAESEKYLLSLGNEVSTMKLGLESMTGLLAALGNPERKYLKVQVAGTNGKGSVCSFLDSICREAGIRVGTYTSPHLISITERIRINGVDISDDEFARFAGRVRETSENLLAEGDLTAVPTFFEQITAIALLAFAEADLKLAILETGLGGRLDATTAARAEIAAITRIDLDHQEYLGYTIEEIAAEKAAIIRSQSQVVVGEQPNAVIKIFKGGNATGRDCVFLTDDHGEDGAHSLPVGFPPLGLAGRHQMENARIAAALVEFLRERFEIADEAVERGLRNARHPGRLEYFGDNRYLFDGAHNAGGARVLLDYLDETVTRPITMVFGAMAGKDVEEIASILFSKAETIILTQPENSRAMTAAAIAEAVDVGGTPLILTLNVSEALKTADEITPNEGLILITGSLYLVGEAKRILQSKI